MAGNRGARQPKRAGRGKVHRFVSRHSSTRWRSLVSPILVRPVREQLEHDRLVRLLQTKSRRRFDAVANPGEPTECARPRGHRLAVSGPAAVFAGPRPAAAGGRRSGDRRVGQPSRGAGAVGAAVEAARSISSCMCPRTWWMSRAGCARTTRCRRPKSGATIWWAISSGSR